MRAPIRLPRCFRKRLPVLVLSMLFISACSSEAPQEMPDPEVGVQIVASQRVSVDQTLPGRTVAFMSSDVRPQVDGILRKRLFVEGEIVKEGQALYEIDPAPYQAALDAARGELAQAEAGVLAARPKAERFETLVALDAISRQEGDDARAALRQSEAGVMAARAALRTAQINLGYTKVVAPIGGQIGTSSFTPGALVSAGQSDVLTTIQQHDPMYVDVVQSSGQLLALRRQLAAGQIRAVDGKPEVRVVLEDGSEHRHRGTLEVVGAQVEEDTGTVRMRAVVPNPERDLLPGMYVRAVIAMAVDEKAVLVPQQAITRDAKGQAQAMIVGKDEKIELRQVETASAVGNQWVIRDGLAPGERLVVEGAQRVRPDMVVRSVEVVQESGADSAKTEPARAAPAPTQG